VRAYAYRPLFYDPWYPFGYRGYGTLGFGPRYGFYDGYGASGAIRIQAKPRETEVFVDGYYAGTVDDFDGIFQRLYAEPGEHTLELYLPGYQSVRENVDLQPGRTSTLELTMQPLGAGDPQPLRPDAGTIPRGDSRDAIGPTRRPDRDASDQRPRETRGANAAPAVENTDANYGTLSLRVQPGEATIVIDGEAWEGPSLDERLVLQITAGRHVVEVRKDGYRGYATELTIREGETSTLNVALAGR
jgi:hypothetical protein